MPGDAAVEGLSLGMAERRREIRRLVLARVRGIGLPARTVGAEYVEGLREAVEVAIDHAIGTALGTSEQPLLVPGPILTQARLAARSGVALETVLRRYLAGHAIVGDFILEEADRRGVSTGELRRILRTHAATTDQVLAAISSTYSEEAAQKPGLSVERREAERVRRLLGGELLNPGELSYGFDRWHTGLVSRGPFDRRAAAGIASQLGADRLIVEAADGQYWTWLATRERLSPEAVAAVLEGQVSNATTIGIGEPGRDDHGWRLTHEQARAALSVALRESKPAARYADVASVASAMQDELLSTSLRELYIAPLRENAAGVVLKETLRAYLTAGQHVTSAAAILGVSRNTVTNRIRTIEQRIGSLRHGRAGDVALAVRLDEMTSAHRQH